MSERNVESHRRFVAAWNAANVEAIIALCDASIEFHSAFRAVGSGTYHGHDGLRSWQRDLTDVWGRSFRVEPEAYFALGEQTLAFYVVHARGRHSGVVVAMPVAHLALWRQGLVVHMKGYADRADAFRDLGLSEQELKRIDP